MENDLYKVKCYNCTLTNCLTKDNGNIKIMLIVRQPPYVMIPVNITGDWYDNQGTRILQLLNNQLFRPKRFVAALILGITALISVIASLTVSAIALTKEVHTATFADQLSKNVTLALNTQEIIDRKLNDKVDALEEAVLAIGQELLTLKIKLALRCHSDFKWICVTPLQVNHSIHTWNKIKNHLEGVWNHSDLSLDITKLHQEIFAMSEGEKAFGAQDLSSQLHSGFKGLVNRSSWLTFFYNIGVSLAVLLIVLLLLPVIFRLLKQSLTKVSIELHTFILKNKKGGDVGSHRAAPVKKAKPQSAPA